MLLPQEEVLDKQGGQVRPPGFHVIIMPYADDIRPVPVDRLAAEATDEQIDAAKAFVEKLALKGRFDPLVYENPCKSHLKITKHCTQTYYYILLIFTPK